MAGTIVELLANEEDTVSVGQDLFRIEAGDGGRCLLSRLVQSGTDFLIPSIQLQSHLRSRPPQRSPKSCPILRKRPMQKNPRTNRLRKLLLHHPPPQRRTRRAPRRYPKNPRRS
jgi:pyruvate/2-oxoglutarate dehydrogenase complex dihydrolipoamide acyltransferase (E2) component